MTSFATYKDLEKRLNRTFSDEEQEWINELLEDASEHLRLVIGQRVYPAATITFTGWPVWGRVDLPQVPVVSVESVTRDSIEIDYALRHGYILVQGEEPVSITYTYGASSPPRELTRLACVLVSQTLLTLEQELGLTAGGLSSVAIDDFRVAFANAGGQTGMTLTPHAEAAIRRAFGNHNVTVVEASS